MPNWCLDSVMFYPGEKGSLENLKQLQQDLETALETIDEGSDNWIGRLLTYKGTSYERTKNREAIYCRSFVDYMDSLEDVQEFECFEIKSSSAWRPMVEMYDWIADTYQLEYVICAEEPGDELYVNTDTEGIYYQERYYISCDQDEEEFDFDFAYCVSLKQVVQFLKEINLPATESMSLEELNQLHDEVSIYEFSASV